MNRYIARLCNMPLGEDSFYGTAILGRGQAGMRIGGELTARGPRPRLGGGVIGDKWGVSQQEVARRYPCDDVIPAPALQLWRGVTVERSAGEVWPWLCQLRLAPYSYDWVDNLGHRSPRELREVTNPRPGEPFSSVAGRFPVGCVVSVAREQQLTATVMGTVMSYVLVPEGPMTRLLLKVVVDRGGWYLPALAVGDWPMARRQLKNLKALAEAERAGGKS